jgi:hypothetical protein
MEALEWFVIGGIIVAAADQIIAKTPWSSNNLHSTCADWPESYLPR